jgi:hypothetical protein
LQLLLIYQKTEESEANEKLLLNIPGFAQYLCKIQQNEGKNEPSVD